jgi:hypothetical protein
MAIEPAPLVAAASRAGSFGLDAFVQTLVQGLQLPAAFNAVYAWE